MSQIVCRAKLASGCLHGRDAESIYGPGSGMGDDGTFDGKTVVCDECYTAAGQPSLPHPASREAVVAHINREMNIGEQA